MKAYDFFCGAGGLTRGLLDAGIEVIAGFDCDERCRSTYEHNNPGVRFVQADIGEIGPKELDLKYRPGDMMTCSSPDAPHVNRSVRNVSGMDNGVTQHCWASSVA